MVENTGTTHLPNTEKILLITVISVSYFLLNDCWYSYVNVQPILQHVYLTIVICHKLNVKDASSSFNKPVKQLCPSCLILQQRKKQLLSTQ